MAIPWTDKEVEVLKELVAAHCDIDNIMKVLKSRSKLAIESKAEALGLSLVPKPEIDFEAFKKFIKSSKEKTI